MKALFAEGGYSLLAARAREGKDAAIAAILRYLESLSVRERNLAGCEPQMTEATVRRSLAEILIKQAKGISGQKEVSQEARAEAAEELWAEARRAERPLGLSVAEGAKVNEEGKNRRRKVQLGPKC